MVIQTDADDNNIYDNNGYFGYEVEDFSDPNQDEFPNDIDDEGVNSNENVNTSSVENPNRGILICNDLNMSNINPDAIHASEFPEYPDILLAHRLATDSEREELFVGQKLTTKEECVFAIKQYNMNVSVDYKVVVSKPTLYIRECWRSTEGYNLRVRATFIQRS